MFFPGLFVLLFVFSVEIADNDYDWHESLAKLHASVNKGGLLGEQRGTGSQSVTLRNQYCDGGEFIDMSTWFVYF